MGLRARRTRGRTTAGGGCMTRVRHVLSAAALLPALAAAALALPAVRQLAHLLCTGPTTPLATYHLDSSDPAATVVYRQDYSGVFDFYYRYVSDSYVQTQPCS